MADKVIYTIGHSNHTIDQFIRFLSAHNINVLVDVRSQPYSKFAPQFNREDLKTEILKEKIMYMYMGEELGGRPLRQNYYDIEGYVLYDRVAKDDRFRQGIQRLENGIRNYQLVLMCSEEDPTQCHRHLLIGKVLHGDGIHVNHIRGNGQFQTEEELMKKNGENQMHLFGNGEVSVWRSTQSVTHRNELPSSSQS